jgi:hypothetical protein
MWRKYKEWFAVLVFISVLTGLILWYLHFNPQCIPRFLIAPIIALGFVVVMFLFPKYRQRFVKKVLSFHVKAQKRGGLLYRYGRIFNAVMIIVLMLFSVVAISNPAVLDIPYIPYLVVALFIVMLISAVAFISGFLRAAGKWGLIIIAIATAMAVLRILVLRNL